MVLGWKERFLNFLTLFTSTGTLICCAIPAAMVTLGFGAALVGLIGEFPQLVWLSEKKVFIFTAGAILLAAGGLMQVYVKRMPCPADRALAEACMSARKNSRRLYYISLGIYAVGVLFSFVLPKLLY